MVSPDVVRKRLRLLEGYLQRLYRIRDSTDLSTFLSDTDRQDIAERNLHLAIEAVLDIGAHVIASSGWTPADEYADVFSILANKGIITAELRARVQGMAGFRNLLVHGYAQVDHAQVFDVLQNRLGDLEDLARVYAGLVESDVDDRTLD
jgi:uncharacterized protein YutE (UPF0331/DUF86 family)